MQFQISGKKTLNENIADDGGLNVALQAYRKFVNDNGKEPKLPGLEEYINEQIYFLSFANVSSQVYLLINKKNIILIHIFTVLLTIMQIILPNFVYQSYYEATTRESLYNSILTSHSPSRLRVIGSLTNSEEFSQEWNCKNGSKMNSKNEKCDSSQKYKIVFIYCIIIYINV